MKHSILTLFVVAFTLPASSIAQNQTFRCGETIIENGDPNEKLLEHCGEPTYKNESTWTYEREGQFNVVVTFYDDGTVSRIQDGG